MYVKIHAFAEKTSTFLTLFLFFRSSIVRLTLTTTTKQTKGYKKVEKNFCARSFRRTILLTNGSKGSVITAKSAPITTSIT